jgi:hypothetical protein
MKEIPMVDSDPGNLQTVEAASGGELPPRKERKDFLGEQGVVHDRPAQGLIPLGDPA